MPGYLADRISWGHHNCPLTMFVTFLTWVGALFFMSGSFSRPSNTYLCTYLKQSRAQSKNSFSEMGNLKRMSTGGAWAKWPVQFTAWARQPWQLMSKLWIPQLTRRNTSFDLPFRCLIITLESFCIQLCTRILQDQSCSIFCSFVTLRVPPLYLGNWEWYHRSAGVKATRKSSENKNQKLKKIKKKLKKKYFSVIFSCPPCHSVTHSLRTFTFDITEWP